VQYDEGDLGLSVPGSNPTGSVRPCCWYLGIALNDRPAQ